MGGSFLGGYPGAPPGVIEGLFLTRCFPRVLLRGPGAAILTSEGGGLKQSGNLDTRGPVGPGRRLAMHKSF